MSERTPEKQEMRRLARHYLLGTLKSAEQERVERELAASPDWTAALEAEREALSALDALLETLPARDLTAAVMEQVHAVEAEQPARRIARPLSAWWAVAPVACVCIVAFILLPALSRARESARRSSSQNNLKQLGIVFKMYANESKGGLYPPLAPEQAIWMFDVESVYPEFLSDLSVLVDPTRPDADELVEELKRLASRLPVDWGKINRIAAKSYTYLPWSVTNDAELSELARRRTKLASADYDKDIQLADARVYRLKEGVERFFITDINNPAASASAQAEIPVMFEAVSERRRPAGRNVLYMDGHVEFVRFGTEFPSTQAAEDAFRAGSE